MPNASSLSEDDRPRVLLWLVAGSLGMVALGSVEVWGERVGGHVDAGSRGLLLLLGLAPIGVMIGAWFLVHRRLVRRGTPALAAGGRAARAALAGWVLLTIAAVLILQSVLFGASSALVQEIDCGVDRDDWCGFGSGIFGVIAFAVGGALGMIGSVLWLITRRTAAGR
jgi:hypothetical protein